MTGCDEAPWERTTARARSLGASAERVEITEGRGGLSSPVWNVERFRYGFVHALIHQAPEVLAPIRLAAAAPREVFIEPETCERLGGGSERALTPAANGDTKQHTGTIHENLAKNFMLNSGQRSRC